MSLLQSHFGLALPPFDTTEPPELLPRQKEILDILLVHAHQGGLCLLTGDIGTGKSAVKRALVEHDPKRLVAPVLNRSLHNYSAILRLLCEAFGVDPAGSPHACERRLIAHAHKLHRAGKMLVPIIDDAQLLAIDTLRRLRLLLDDFPRNHNLVLIAQPELLGTLGLRINEDIRSRLTFSAALQKLDEDAMSVFLTRELDRCGLAHSSIEEAAFGLIVRHAEGVLRHARNLALGALLEAAHARAKTVGLDHINAVLLQPHWRARHHPGAGDEA